MVRKSNTRCRDKGKDYEDEEEREIHKKNRSASRILRKRTQNSNFFMQESNRVT